MNLSKQPSRPKTSLNLKLSFIKIDSPRDLYTTQLWFHSLLHQWPLSLAFLWKIEAFSAKIADFRSFESAKIREEIE